jgi:hypothetical protein
MKVGIHEATEMTASEAVQKLREQPKWAYDMLFSAYCALLILAEEMSKGSSALLGRLGSPLVYLNDLLARMRGRPAIPLGIGVYTLGIWGVIVLIVFVCMHLSRRAGPVGKIVERVSGIVTVVGFPVIWLRLSPMNGLSSDETLWLWLEAAGMAGCVILFASGKLPVYAAVPCSILHFALWGWVTRNAISFEWWSALVLLGLCTAGVWAVLAQSSSARLRANPGGRVLPSHHEQ